MRRADTLAQALKLSRQLVEHRKKREQQHIAFFEDRTEIYTSNHTKLYVPSDTGHKFVQDKHFVSLVMGPYGSGKSTMCAQKIVKSACEMPAWSNNRRKCRGAIVRNTSGELQSTTLQTWLQWFGDLGDISKRQKPILTYEHRFNDGHGIVELEILFLALDRPDDVRKIKSLELTWCYINELSEVPQAALSHMKGRVGRYPGPAFCNKPYHSFIICDTNPPDQDHWIVKDFEEKRLENYVIFKQPPGLVKHENTWVRNDKADNINHLPKDYYEKLAEGQTEEFVKVFCLGQYGTVGTGKVVYPEYNDDLHSIEIIPAIQGEPIHLFWDFGLTPACLVMQLAPNGQLRALKEYCSQHMGIKTFAESIVIPSLARDFPYNKIGFSNADPAGMHRSEIMEEMSCIGVLNELGIITEPAKTNDIEPRINSVKFFLNRMIDGKPGFLLSRTGCPTLRKGFIKNYYYKRIAVANEERYRNVPEKNMSSHVHDPCQYGALKFAPILIEQEKPQTKIVDIWNPAMRIF